MDILDIEAKVITFIRDSVQQEYSVELNGTTSFNDLGLDSLDVAQLLFEAEDAFGVSFDMEKAASIASIRDIATYISNYGAPLPA